MSTKVTAFYIDIEYLYLHIYADFGRCPGLDISINKEQSTHVDLTQEELKQLIVLIQNQIEQIKKTKEKKFLIDSKVFYFRIDVDNLIIGLNSERHDKHCPTKFHSLSNEEVEEVFRQILEDNKQLEIWDEL